MNQPWTAWLKISHAALAIVLACYLLMVVVNSFLFDYSFWNDPPPSTSADLFAVVSLWVLFAGTSLIGAVTYAWMCAFASDPVNGLRTPLRQGIRATLRKWWLAVPGFAATTLACAFFVPGMFAIAILGPLPFRSSGTRLRDQLALADETSSIRVGAVVAFVVASTNWTAILLGGYLVSRFDGPVEGVAALLAYLAYLCSALAAAWAASAFASPPAGPSATG